MNTKMTCEQAETALAAGVDPVHCRSLAAHLAECRACRELSAFCSEVRNAPLPSWTPPLPSRARPEVRRVRKPLKFGLRIWPLAAAATVAVAAAMLATRFELVSPEEASMEAPAELIWDGCQQELGELEAAFDAFDGEFTDNFAEMFRNNWEETTK